MEIIFEDRDIIVAVKPNDLVSESTPDKKGFADLLAEHTHGQVATIHRLDRGVGGLMIYAKTQNAAAELSKSLQDHQIKKQYLAVIEGTPFGETGELRDYLIHDRNLNKTTVVKSTGGGAKEAILDYTVLASGEWNEKELSLVRIDLITGRTHQIRAQFSSRGFPLIGDRKYGSHTSCPIGLSCVALDFPHPITKKQMHFERDPQGQPWEELFPLYFNTKKS